MPRLRQVPRAEATAPIVLRMYNALFGDRDPVVADDLLVIVGHRPGCDPDPFHVVPVCRIDEGGHGGGVRRAGPPE